MNSNDMLYYQNKFNEYLPDKYRIKYVVPNATKLNITIFRKSESDWEAGEYVRSYVKDGATHIRTDDNKVDSDNLGTLPDIE